MIFPDKSERICSPNTTSAPAIPAAITAGMTGVRVIVGVIRVARGGVKAARKIDKLTDDENEDEDEGENEKRGFQDMHVIRTFNRVHYIAARQDPNQRAWQLCHDQLTNATVEFSGPAEGGKYFPLNEREMTSEEG